MTLVYQGGLRWLPSSSLPDGDNFKAANETGVPRRIALGPLLTPQMIWYVVLTSNIYLQARIMPLNGTMNRFSYPSL